MALPRLQEQIDGAGQLAATAAGAAVAAGRSASSSGGRAHLRRRPGLQGRIESTIRPDNDRRSLPRSSCSGPAPEWRPRTGPTGGPPARRPSHPLNTQRPVSACRARGQESTAAHLAAASQRCGRGGCCRLRQALPVPLVDFGASSARWAARARVGGIGTGAAAPAAALLPWGDLRQTKCRTAMAARQQLGLCSRSDAGPYLRAPLQNPSA
jgi:hypothetical protein